MARVLFAARRRGWADVASCPRPGGVRLIPGAEHWVAADFPSLLTPLSDHSPLTPSPLSLSPMSSWHPQLPASALAIAGALRGGRLRVWASGSVVPRQTRGNSGSCIILMKDDAWQAYVLSKHQGSWREGGVRGGEMGWLRFLEPPSRWLPVPTGDR